jgi:hypothetical protein
MRGEEFTPPGDRQKNPREVVAGTEISKGYFETEGDAEEMRCIFTETC